MFLFGCPVRSAGAVVRRGGKHAVKQRHQFFDVALELGVEFVAQVIGKVQCFLDAPRRGGKMRVRPAAPGSRWYNAGSGN